ncbi:MAG: TIGR01777 family protein [Calditrichaeota bacterium]|nr:MAG: TIGR01777 family protein [Calditrichota bacterium]
MKFFITGGTGFIGSRLVKALIQDEHEICLLARNPQKQHSASEKIKMLTPGDLKKFENVSYLTNADVVINLAGENIGNRRWTKSQKEKLLSSRIKTTRFLVDTLNLNSDSGPRMINASAIGFYGSQKNKQITESAPAGNDLLARICDTWETEARKLNQAKTRLTILRIGVVLDRDQGAFPKMLLPFKFFIGGKLGTGKQWVSWIHIDDLIDVFKFVIFKDDVSGIFNATAPTPVTNSQLTHAIAKAFHRPALFPVPAFILKILLGQQSTLVLEGQQVIPKNLLESGFKFKHGTIDSALADLYL